MTPETLRTSPAADAMRRHRLVAVLRRVEPRSALLDLVDELVDAGVRAFEITLDAPDAAGDLAAVREGLAGRDCLVGAGTVLHPEQLVAARDAGAEFVVSPILDRAIVSEALASGLVIVPGALTPTEVLAAWTAGATFVKVFPASAVGPSFVRELRGPLPQVELIPTGGVDGSNAPAFLAAGAAAVGIGSAIVRADTDTRGRIVRSILEAPR